MTDLRVGDIVEDNDGWTYAVDKVLPDNRYDVHDNRYDVHDVATKMVFNSVPGRDLISVAGLKERT